MSSSRHIPERYREVIINVDADSVYCKPIIFSERYLAENYFSAILQCGLNQRFPERAYSYTYKNGI